MVSIVVLATGGTSIAETASRGRSQRTATQARAWAWTEAGATGGSWEWSWKWTWPCGEVDRIVDGDPGTSTDLDHRCRIHRRGRDLKKKTQNGVQVMGISIKREGKRKQNPGVSWSPHRAVESQPPRSSDRSHTAVVHNWHTRRQIRQLV